MKKILALLIAAMLALTSAFALAENTGAYLDQFNQIFNK